MARQTKNSVKYEEYKTTAQARTQAGGIPVFCAYDKLINPKELVGNPRNPNRHPHNQIELLAHIIQAQGWRAPITVSNRSGYVVRGHGRLAAALFFNAECVPVDYQNYENEAEEWADLIADNRLAELSEIDKDMVADLIAEMNDLPTFITGYSELNLEMLVKSEHLDEFEPEPPAEPKSKQGEIYKLGRHRLMCGDSTSISDVKELMGGGNVDLLITDPPYNVDYEGTAGKIQNDKMEDKKFREFLTKAFSSAKSVMKGGAVFYIWHADSEGYNFRGACFDIGWEVSECLIWKKDRLVLGRQDYQWNHEPCLYGFNGEEEHAWYNDKKQTTVLEFNRPTASKEHPTMKPVKLFDYLIRNSSKDGDLVLDLFGGSGTTIMACELNNRNAYCMELDPKFVDVIINRWENFTGQKAELITG